MQKYIYSAILLGCLVLFGCQTKGVTNQEPFPPLIPKPQQLTVNEGSFVITKNTTLYFEDDFKNAEDFLINYLQKGSGLQLNKTIENKASIVFKKDTSLLSESYNLSVSSSAIIVNAKDESGAFMPFKLFDN